MWLWLLLLLQLLGHLGGVDEEAQALVAGREGRGLLGLGAGDGARGGDAVGQGLGLLDELCLFLVWLGEGVGVSCLVG